MARKHIHDIAVDSGVHANIGCTEDENHIGTSDVRSGLTAILGRKPHPHIGCAKWFERYFRPKTTWAHRMCEVNVHLKKRPKTIRIQYSPTPLTRAPEPAWYNGRGV